MSIPDIIVLTCSGILSFVSLLVALRIRKQIIVKNVGKMVENLKGEHDEQLATLIASLSKRYPEVSFAKLSRIAVAVSNWEVKRMTKITEEELKRGERGKDISKKYGEQGNYYFWDGYEACAEYLQNNLRDEKDKNHNATQDDI